MRHSAEFLNPVIIYDRPLSLLDQWMITLDATRSEANLTKAALKVLINLLQCHNNKTAQCNPGHESLARSTRLSKTSVKNAINELEEERFIIVHRRKGFGTNAYSFVVRPDVTGLVDGRRGKPAVPPQEAELPQKSKITYPNKENKRKNEKGAGTFKGIDRSRTVQSVREALSRPEARTNRQLHLLEKSVGRALEARGLPASLLLEVATDKVGTIYAEYRSGSLPRRKALNALLDLCLVEHSREKDESSRSA